MFPRGILWHPASLVVAVLALSCIGENSGPPFPRSGQLRLAPSFETSAPSGLVTIDRVRILLFRTGSNTPALDTVAQLSAGDTLVDLSLTVAIFTAAETFTAQLALITPAGDTAFRGGPLTVIGTPVGGGATPTVFVVPLTYVGIGAEADRVTITVHPASVFTGDTVQFEAVAYANEVPIPGTPIGWRSLDEARATVPQAPAGKVVGGAQRGSARIVAQLLTGPADTGSVTVNLAPAVIGIVSGNNQSGSIGSALPLPLVAQLKASDSVVVPGVWVRFALTAGGGTLSADSVVSDTDGLATVSWTLGSTLGAQSVRVTSAKGAGVQNTFAATGVAVATQLAFSTGPTSTVTGGLISPAVVVEVRDPFGNVATGFGGTVSVAIGANPAGGTLSGTTSVSAVSGVATFADLRIDQVGKGYTLVASAVGLTSATSSAFDILAPSGTVYWAAPVSGNWSDGTKWSTGTVPTSTDAAAITQSGTYTVTLDQNVSVAGLTLGGASGTQTLDQSGYTLTLNGPSTIGAQGQLYVSGGSPALDGSGLVTNQGTLTMYYATLNSAVSNEGLLVARGSTSILGTLTTTASSVMLVEGDYNCCAAYLTVANGFTNNGTINLTDVNGTGSYAYLTVTNGTLVNAAAGTIASLVGTGGTRYLDAALDNRGTLTVSQPLSLSRYDAAHTNSGTIDLAANLTIFQNGTSPSFTNSGTITIAAGDSLIVQYGALNQSAGTIGGAGTLALNGVTANLTTNFNNATTGLALTSSTVNGPGTLTNATGHTLTLYYSTIVAPFVNQGTLLVRGYGYLSGAAGTFTTEVGSILQVEGDYTCCAAYLTVANGFTNNGTIDLTDVNGTGSYAYLTVTNGTLVNAAGATIASSTGTGGVRYLDAELDNQGTLTVSQPLEIYRYDAAHTNSGAIDLAANLTIYQSGTSPSFTNTGTISVAAGDTLEVQYGTLNQSAGSIGGAGTLSLYGMTANLTTNFSNATTGLALTSSTVNGPGTLTNAAGRTLTLNYSTIAAPFINEGTLIARATSYLTGAPGSFTTGAASVLLVEGDYNYSGAYLTVTNGFTNNGTINLTAINGTGSAAYLTVTNGTLVNAAGATIASLVGTGGTRQLDVQLDNQGTVTVSQSLSMTRSNSAHINTGAIDLAANLTISQSGTSPSFTNSGTITIPAGNALTIQNGTLNQSAGSIGGAGTLSLYGVTANLTTNFSNATTYLALNSSTVNGPGTLTNATGDTLTLYYSTIAAPFVNQGALWAYGYSYLSGAAGTFTTEVGSELRVEGDITIGTGYLTVANGFTNKGTINLTVGTSSSAYLAVTNGTLVNAPGATIASLGGAGTRQLDAELDNQGTLTVLDYPLTVSRTSALHTSSGTLDVRNGTLAFTGAGSSLTLQSSSLVKTYVSAANTSTALSISGTATLAGTLTMDFSGYPSPASGEVYTPVTYGSAGGSRFGQINPSTLNPNYGATALTLTVP